MAGGGCCVAFEPLTAVVLGQIYVLLYKEVGIGVMANDSSGAKARLLALGHQKNVFVIRHPNHLSISSGAL